MEGKFRGDSPPRKVPKQLTLSAGKAHIADMISFNAHIRIQRHKFKISMASIRDPTMRFSMNTVPEYSYSTRVRVFVMSALQLRHCTSTRV